MLKKRAFVSSFFFAIRCTSFSMDILNYYHSALKTDRQPALLEFNLPGTGKSLKVCGIDPITTLEVRNGVFFKDGQKHGAALQIFEHFSLNRSDSFFPAYIGYFSYEFAENFNKPFIRGRRSLPDAFFQLFDRGLIIEDVNIIQHDEILFAKCDNFELCLEPQELQPALERLDFFKKIEQIKSMIRLGDVYQVNFSLPFFFDATNLDICALYAAMKRYNASPFMGILANNDWSLLSGSPERLFSYKDNIITARPIAGTKKRGSLLSSDNEQLADLKSCPKENAEHVMLVDLMRNDLNQVSATNSVKVLEDRTIEFYSHVMHLVSELHGQSNLPYKDVMASLFPGGTITGAPKESVMNAIAELEVMPRGPYTGSMGYISSGYGIDMNILIRSVIKYKDQGWTNTGAGIVIDSDKEREWEEVHKKASALNDIISNKVKVAERRSNIKGPMLVNPSVKNEHTNKNVLFFENNDSFSFNIINALRSLGAKVTIASHQQHALSCSHIILGPGPGNPESMPALRNIIEWAINKNIALLGICLGHQALGHYFGARIKKLIEPVHGKSFEVHHAQEGLFKGLKLPSIFTRYHSLAIAEAPADFNVDAYCLDDTIMAIRHKKLPLFGIQFHPESYLSEEGLLLLDNFLRTDNNYALNQWTRNPD